MYISCLSVILVSVNQVGNVFVKAIRSFELVPCNMNLSETN